MSMLKYLDDLSSQELEILIHFIGKGIRPITPAKKLFPLDFPNNSEHIIEDTKLIRNYAWNKLTAFRIIQTGRSEKHIKKMHLYLGIALDCYFQIAKHRRIINLEVVEW